VDRRPEQPQPYPKSKSDAEGAPDAGHAAHKHDGHGHDGHGHAHGGHEHTAGLSERRLALAALITAVFMVAEFAGGLVSGSLALIADAGHMLTDCAGLALAWLGMRLSRRPADRKRTYGYDRFGILVAYSNGLLLFLVTGWIVLEAIDRITTPAPVLGGMMLWIAVAGLAVNCAVLWMLHGGDQHNLNIRAAVLHVLGDLLGSVGAIAAALVILFTGWTLVDPLLSILVAVLILVSAWRLVRDSSHILLEGSPEGIDANAISADLMQSVRGVLNVHHVHVWSLSQERPLVTLHVRLAEGEPATAAVRSVKERLKTQFGLDHATVEIEAEDCADRPSGCVEPPGSSV
jgi:cobalt-zinc-cadmium efflux system protein